MKTFQSKIFYFLLGLFLATAIPTVYAAWNDPISSGDPLTAQKWNNLVDQVESMDNNPLNNVTCVNSNWVNNFDYGVSVVCGEGYLAGIRSYHDDDTEDRRFMFKCCFPEGADPNTMVTCEGGNNSPPSTSACGW